MRARYQLYSSIPVEDTVANRTYWLTLMDRKPQGPSYTGRILDYDAESVTVEIDVMASNGGDTTATETWPRSQTVIATWELPS